ncbi:COG1470 family protein [Natronospora cellulosivora (SeqCode)]
MQMKSEINKRIIPLLALIVIIFTLSVSAEAMGVRPLVIDMEMSPGETREFEINLTPSDTDQIVSLSFYQPVQLSTGSLTYQEADPAHFPAVNWLSLEQNRVELQADENRRVRGTVTVPFDAAASHTVVIMVEPEAGTAQQGVSFKVRYAVRLNINIERAGLRPQGELDNFEFTFNEQGVPSINTVFRNTSPLHYDVSAEATIRDERGNLVERFPLKTNVAWQGGRDSTRIYPGSELIFSGNLARPLRPGNYELRLFFRYAGGRQIIERHDISVEESFDIEEGFESIRISPEILELELRPGAVSSQPIEVENLSGDIKTISINARDIDINYPKSIFSSLDISIRGGQEITLRPYGRQRVVLSIQAPRDLEPGGYYGYLDFIDSSEESEEMSTLNLQVLSNVDGIESSGEIASLYHDQRDEENIFSIEVKNTGDIHFVPEGSLVLRNTEGNIDRALNLNSDSNLNEILPGRSELIILLSDKIEKGKYIAEVSLRDKNRELSMEEFEIIIE